MAFFRKISSLSSFFQSSSFIFGTFVHSKTTVGSKSGLPFFVMYKHLSVTLCSVSLRFWSRCGFLSSTHSKCLDADVDTFHLISSPNISTASLICFLIEISDLFSFVIVRSIPRNSCEFPRVIVRSLNFSWILWTYRRHIFLLCVRYCYCWRTNQLCAGFFDSPCSLCTCHMDLSQYPYTWVYQHIGRTRAKRIVCTRRWPLLRSFIIISSFSWWPHSSCVPRWCHTRCQGTLIVVSRVAARLLASLRGDMSQGYQT